MGVPPREDRFDSMLTIRGQRVRVRYWAGLGEDAWFLAARARVEEALQAGAEHAAYLYRQLAARAIAAWDLRDGDGRPIEVGEAPLEALPIGGLQRIVREAAPAEAGADRDAGTGAGGLAGRMRDAERAEALARLRDADEACYRAQEELAELDATIERVRGATTERSALESWRARRAELLRVASEHAGRVAALYAALHVRGDAPVAMCSGVGG